MNNFRKTSLCWSLRIDMCLGLKNMSQYSRCSAVKQNYCSNISWFFGMCRVQYKGHTCSGEVSNTTLKLCDVFCFFSSVVQTCGTTKSTFQCISIHRHILVLFFITFLFSDNNSWWKRHVYWRIQGYVKDTVYCRSIEPNCGLFSKLYIQENWLKIFPYALYGDPLEVS